MSSFSVGSSSSNIQQIQNSTSTSGAAIPWPSHLPVTFRQVPYDIKSSDSLDQLCLRNLGFVGKANCIPMKEEPDLIRYPNVSQPVLQSYPFHDHSSAFT
ncbi:unnamed protein product [Vicia faba]|uniref:Uncharacterized protein n=1 Tax=Vicia faba TaxID=3906 RepID=A0AAV1A843_VICFA|nr:unnamed protein product [Vicia faba]